MKKIEKLKKDYHAVEIPSELQAIVKDSIRQAKAEQKKRPILKKWLIIAAAATILFIGSINLSPTMARAIANIPGLAEVVEIFTVQTLTVDEATYQANFSIPAIDGLENKELQASLNDKYIEENKALYEQFEEEVAEMKEVEGGHLGVDSGYEVLADSEQLLSIARYEVNTVGSSSTTMKYDTIDKQQNILITLPSLFENDKYIEVISSYIAREMNRQMSMDDEIYYFSFDGLELDFEEINPEQGFYITTTNKLVISFDKYEVAPGYMGIVTFEIPSDILRNLLVSDVYIN